MEKEIQRKVIGITLATLALLGLFYVGVQFVAIQKTNLKTVWVAARDIPPRTKIQSTDLISMQVPAIYIDPYAYTNQEDIVDRYTEIQGMIPAGSLFYKRMLFEESQLPDFPSTQLKEGQAAYTLETDMARLGGELQPGQRVDVYVSITKNTSEPPITGCLIQNARVIAIKDHKGLDLSNPSSTGIPFLAILAVNESDLEILSIAEAIGNVRLFSGTHTYDTDSEAQIHTDTELYAYLNSRSLEELPTIDVESTVPFE